MYLATPNRALLRSIAAGAVMLAAAACSRSDRSETSGTAGDNTRVQTGAASSTDTGSVASSASPSNQPATSDTAALTQSEQKSAQAPKSEPKRTAQQSSHTGVSAYRAMSHSEQASADTLSNQTESDRISSPEDSSGTGGAPEMARDTSSSLAQADTTTPEQTDTSSSVSEDSSAVQAQVDTTQQTELAQQAPVDSAAPVQTNVDTTQAPTDTAAVRIESDTDRASQPSEVAPQSAQIRPPEDSSETRGNVTDNNSKAEVAASDQQADSAAVGAANVGSGTTATGADAVALVTREGRRCEVVTDAAERRDLASSPATLNPCGTGTMTLPAAKTEEE